MFRSTRVYVWVVFLLMVSGCATTPGHTLSGLTRGFFFPDASSLLVTHWEVETESAAEITTQTIQRYVRDRRMSRAQALQQTSVEMIEGKSAQAEWSHPAFWAPYALVGNGRRGSAR